MFEAAASGLPHLDLPKIVLAIGSLGTAAYGVVDVSKGFGGGISNRGFGDIKKVISQFIPASSASGSALSLTSVLATLPRFDLLLTAVLDQGYQRGDIQKHRQAGCGSGGDPLGVVGSVGHCRVWSHPSRRFEGSGCGSCGHPAGADGQRPRQRDSGGN